MRRREFLGLAGASTLAWPIAGLAQRQSAPSIVFLGAGGQGSFEGLLACFRQGLRQLGWDERKSITIAYRWAEADMGQMSKLAEEAVRLRPKLIVVNGTPASQAVARATSTIPVVFTSVSDPVASGIVRSLARPGANVTGVSNFLPATTGKLLELLKLAAPKVSRAGVLHNPDNPAKIIEIKELRQAAQATGIAVEPLIVRSSGDFDHAFDRFAQARCNGLVTLQEALMLANRPRVIEFATRNRLPSIYQVKEYVEAGGLMSYGFNFCAQFRSAAAYVDKILKGARPADLPVELPTSFELVINLRTAAALGLKIPQTLLARTDDVIR